VSGAEACLVTGATGFIGSHLVPRLVQDGYAVRCLVRDSADTTALERLGVELAPGRLEDPASLYRAVDGCDFVVHCGAMVSDWGTVEEIERVNVEGTRHLVEAAAKERVTRFVQISSSDVYGHPGSPAVREDLSSSAEFRNWYAQSKLEAEREVAGVASAHGLDTVVLRPATVYGPRALETVGKIGTAIKGGYMLLVDRGRAIAGLVYIDNLVDAILLALRHPDARGEAFNVTDGLPVTWKQYTDGLADAIGAGPARLSLPYGVANGVGHALEGGYRALRKSAGLHTTALLSRQAVQIMGHDQDFSNRKARDLLGWAPRVGYDEGMATTVAWLRDEYLSRD
jgi:nucleoside-diphosphate-sugar epimerase